MENQTESVVWGIHSQDDSLFLDNSNFAGAEHP